MEQKTLIQLHVNLTDADLALIAKKIGRPEGILATKDEAKAEFKFACASHMDGIRQRWSK